MLKFIIIIITLTSSIAFCINDNNEKKNPEEVSFWDGEWYFSWGYNRDYWYPSDIHVSQPALGNDFVVHNVRAEDFPEWTDGVWNKDISEPQYSLRIGHFFDSDRSWGVEFNYDHTKYSSYNEQYARVSGMINGTYIDSIQLLTTSYFRYHLHNGANHVMINLVKRFPVLFEINETHSIALLVKVGGGIMLPHSENTILGQYNRVGSKEMTNYFGTNKGWWQLNGWTVGIEIALRYVFYKPFYFEFSNKEAYSKLYNIPVYKGTAEQSLWMNEFIFSLGYTYDSFN
ncbi:hypothetical protein QEJ31_07205 [Pigmentibacter sp. JX0631]|uniref:hypothetical protein n=1 Tax=Pigmentibacter sp. JX0631 TaxID=2976982 RepID=UPI0024684338|nr:hypothetical protein [Pigmentibacter sp. JX0631]WGL61378.1 hypothetical protein QEJ31_07205 [Pigmentibacter sp. JX0631]